MKLVFATNNRHKLEEACRILDGDVEILSLSEIGCHDDIPETSPTLEGNALQKARWIKEKYGYDCFADDTGLMVDALGGAPGVYSARYAGPDHDSVANMRKLLGEMEGKSDRRAHFSTAVALIRGDEEYIFEGRVDGRIAGEPSGTGGFGYDPVFVADESGLPFACMSAEEKNAISHRGRAMRKLAEFLRGIIPVLMLAVTMLLPAGNITAESWRIHPTYNGYAARMMTTPAHTYYICETQEYGSTFGHHIHIFRSSPDGSDMEFLNVQNGLTSTLARAAEYNYVDNYLCVAYPDGSLDILSDNGKLRHLPGLAVADSDMSREIRAISFEHDKKRIWLATDFGYAVIDAEGGEMVTSRNFKQKVTSVAPFGDKIFIVAGGKLLVGDPSARSLDEFREIEADGPELLMPVGNRLYLRCVRYWEKYLSRIIPDGDSYRVTDISTRAETAVEEMARGIMIIGKEDLYLYDKTKDFERTAWRLSDPDKYKMASTADGRDFWFCHLTKGFTRKRAEGEGGATRWTILSDEFFPDVSNVFVSSSMLHTADLGLLVQNNGITHDFASNFITSPDLLSAYKGLSWTPLSTRYTAPDVPFKHYMPDAVARDPRNPDHIYSGSAISGLFRTDLSAPEKSLHISHKSDQGNKVPGFIAAVDELPDQSWHFAALNRPHFDSYGNLWMTHHLPEVNLNDNDQKNYYYELWAWTPEARLATKDAATFRPFVKFRLSGARSIRVVHSTSFQYPSSRNIIAATGGSDKSALHLLDFNGTVEDKSDDRVVMIGTAYDQDSQPVSMGGIRCWYEEPSSGTVWVGGNGVFTFEPAKMMDNATVRRIKVSRNDGTNLADYLLDGVHINAITADASGDKWFATSGAGVVRTSSDGRIVKKTYTAENSLLPENTVHAICYNPDNNSMMISTANGLCELFLDGGAGGSGESTVRAYPNPVRPGFSGYVTIDGLPEDAAVKILDASGNVVKNLDPAVAGETRWDVTNFNMKRVPGGVYFIQASAGPDGEEYGKIGKITVVN